MFKIIACDLDGTLLTDEKKVSEKDLVAIKKAREVGVKFVPATGRGYKSVGNTLKQLETFAEKNEYVISFNGGAITENFNEHILSFNGLPFSLANEIYKRGVKFDVCMHVYTQKTVYAYNYNDEDRKYVQGRMEIEEIFNHDLEFLRNQKIAKILYADTNIPHLNELEKAVSDITAETDISYSSNRYLEFNAKGINKGFGLLKLADFLEIDHKDTIAIGDNLNDLSMIKVAGLGVCVANGNQQLKESSDYVTTATNNEGAVAEVIERFILGNL